MYAQEAPLGAACLHAVEQGEVCRGAAPVPLVVRARPTETKEAGLYSVLERLGRIGSGHAPKTTLGEGAEAGHTEDGAAVVVVVENKDTGTAAGVAANSTAADAAGTGDMLAVVEPGTDEDHTAAGAAVAAEVE